MALTDRNIVITPNRGASTEPTILFTGADASSSATITLRVINSGTVGTLSFEGTSGQLFSLSDSMSGTIFSVNDVSGIPSIEVLDTGQIKLAQYNGYVSILGSTNATSTTTGVLQVTGGVGIGGNLYVGGSITAASISGSAGSTTAALTMNNGGGGAASGTTFDGSTARTISYNTIGAPSIAGANATGTWNISILGDAGTLDGIDSSQFTQSKLSPNTDFNSETGYSYVSSISGATNTPFGAAWYNLVNIRHRGGLTDGNTYGGQIAVGMTAYGNRMAFRNHNSSVWGSWCEVYNTGNTSTNAQFYSLGIGTPASGTQGEIRAANEITAYYTSDARLKESVVVIGDPITKLMNIRGVYFDWTDEHIKSRGGEDGYYVRKHDIGVIAQEVEEILPEIVATRDNGYKAVKYEKIVPLLIECIKEQQTQINQILERLENLTNK